METYPPYFAANAPGQSLDYVDQAALINNCGSLYGFPWEQWYAADQFIFPSQSHSVAPDANLCSQDGPQQHGEFITGPSHSIAPDANLIQDGPQQHSEFLPSPCHSVAPDASLIQDGPQQHGEIISGPCHDVTPNTSLYTQDGPHQHNEFVPGYANHKQNEWMTSVSPQDCPAFLPDSEPAPSQSPPCKSEAQSASSSGQGEKRKRRSTTTNEGAPAKSSRRGSRKNSSEGTAEDTTPVSDISGPTEITIANTPSPGDDSDEYWRRVQERNRAASNKSRIKKRADVRRLKSDEEDSERINHDLSKCVADLSAEIYQLKRKLLQHTDCDCALIQAYIANEAKRYIHELDGGKQRKARGRS
ncbi:hypothetical protein ACHAPT_011284 [Fusarium lateritium]